MNEYNCEEKIELAKLKHVLSHLCQTTTDPNACFAGKRNQKSVL